MNYIALIAFKIYLIFTYYILQFAIYYKYNNTNI